jgi:small-conductance mechanosensitive channel
MTIELVLESIGVKVTLLLAGFAELLLGIGLGLQQTFNDVVSGIIYVHKDQLK